MHLTSATVTYFKSIDDSNAVSVDPEITVLVGQNESGKTAFLQALEKARPVRSGIAFDVTSDYPRKDLTKYKTKHGGGHAKVVRLDYELGSQEIVRINKALGTEVVTSPELTLQYRYDGSFTITLSAQPGPLIEKLVDDAKLSGELAKQLKSTSSIQALLKALEEADRNEAAESFLSKLREVFSKAIESNWTDLLRHKVWHELMPNPPKFLYFGEYQRLPGKVNLQTLKARVDAESGLTPEDETVLRLIRMADLKLDDIVVESGYEKAKAQLEGLSNTITDQIFEFWTQNSDLDVEFDIRPDPKDVTPFNSGPNLYIRIRSRRHRVTVPFDQRSKGFIWFFSFLVWFDSVNSENTSSPLILLLDEPGLSLHAMAQYDLLRYFDKLAERHQLIYTTHSPFMVHGDRLHQVRVVEDTVKHGTLVSDNVQGSDRNTLFPLQAALGYTVAQNLFISKSNLLVEGPADLIYLKFMSSKLEEAGRVSLRDDITIVPAGGLDKVASFVALLGGNSLDIAVLHDLGSSSDDRLGSLVHQKILKSRQLLNYGMFRDSGDMSKDGTPPPTDVEDLLTLSTYLKLFNGAYSKVLGGNKLQVSKLPEGKRIVDRINRYLSTNSISVRPSGGFNHYLPASYLASKSITPDDKTLTRFERLFEAVNELF